MSSVFSRTLTAPYVDLGNATLLQALSFGGGSGVQGAAQNLLRWTSTRSIKETLVPPTDHAYPHMG